MSTPPWADTADSTMARASVSLLERREIEPGQTAKARLQTMRDTDDGFVIAEQDLRLRGPGEMLGRRQSGVEAFRLADPYLHGELLAAAHDDARLILARDPDLKSARGENLRTLLYLFGRDEAVRYLRTG
jgi:ATP-dependent DNA helicase RecG